MRSRRMRLCEPRDRIKAPGASPGTAGRNATPSAMPSGVHAVVAWRRKALRNVTVPRLAPGGFYGRHSPGRTPLPFGRSGNKSPGREPGDCGSECHRRLPCRPGSTPWLHGGATRYARSQSPGLRLGAFMAVTAPGRTPLPFGRSGNKSPGREPGDCGSECHRRLPCRPGSTPWLHGHARLYATSQSPGLRPGLLWPHIFPGV